MYNYIFRCSDPTYSDSGQAVVIVTLRLAMPIKARESLMHHLKELGREDLIEKMSDYELVASSGITYSDVGRKPPEIKKEPTTNCNCPGCVAGSMCLHENSEG